MRKGGKFGKEEISKGGTTPFQPMLIIMLIRYFQGCSQLNNWGVHSYIGLLHYKFVLKSPVLRYVITNV